MQVKTKMQAVDGAFPRTIDYVIQLPLDAQEIAVDDRTGQRQFRCSAPIKDIDYTAVERSIEELKVGQGTKRRLHRAIERTMDRVLSSKLGAGLVKLTWK